MGDEKKKTIEKTNITNLPQDPPTSITAVKVGKYEFTDLGTTEKIINKITTNKKKSKDD